MKKIAGVIVVLLCMVAMVAACAPTRSISAIERVTTVETEIKLTDLGYPRLSDYNLYRIHDTHYGVTCYVYSGTISCVVTGE